MRVETNPVGARGSAPDFETRVTSWNAEWRMQSDRREARDECPVRNGRVLRTDNKRASKVVVSIIARVILTQFNAEVCPVRPMSGRTHKSRAKSSLALREHGADLVVASDRIIGCPHEEGADYPIGAKCPFCPFWRNQNRFTA